MWNTVIDNIKDENVRDIGIAMSQQAASASCIESTDADKCKAAVKEVLKGYNKRPDKETLKLSLSKGQAMAASMKGENVLKALQDNLVEFSQNYIGSYLYFQKMKVGGLNTYNYYCPFTKSELSEDKQTCVCKQERYALCQMIEPFFDENDKGRVILNYPMSGTDTSDSKTTGQADDNWLTGVKSCNSLNCLLFSNMIQNAADRERRVRLKWSLVKFKEIKKSDKELPPEEEEQEKKDDVQQQNQVQEDEDEGQNGKQEQTQGQTGEQTQGQTGEQTQGQTGKQEQTQGQTGEQEQTQGQNGEQQQTQGQTGKQTQGQTGEQAQDQTGEQAQDQTEEQQQTQGQTGEQEQAQKQGEQEQNYDCNDDKKLKKLKQTKKNVKMNPNTKRLRKNRRKSHRKTQ